jgi:uncharacterized protein DUF4345
MGRRGLQVVLAGIGGVATIAGARGVLKGSAEVIEGGPVSANVDSEYRFYASWYHVLGLLVLRAARRPEREATIVRMCAGGFLVAACGRMLSIRSAGPPHAFQKVLLGLELAIPALIVPWQARVAADSRS